MMKGKTKAVLACVLALALGALILPRVIHYFNSRNDPARERERVNEAQYSEMKSAYVIADSVSLDHPTRRLWRERKAALLKEGYIETREIEFKQPFDPQWSDRRFFDSFRAHYPGVECSVEIRSAKKTSAVIVTARKRDFEAIERFISRYKND